MHYVVLYEIDPTRVGAFEQAVRGLGDNCLQVTCGAITICSNLSPEYAYNVLVPFIQTTDRFVLLQLAQNGTRRGWLPQKSWQWFDCHLGTQKP
jgi:hypothetical protein